MDNFLEQEAQKYKANISDLRLNACYRRLTLLDLIQANLPELEKAKVRAYLLD